MWNEQKLWNRIGSSRGRRPSRVAGCWRCHGTGNHDAVTGDAVVMLHRRLLDGSRLRWLTAVALACLIAAAIPLHSLIFARAPGSQVSTEAGSTYERILLGDQAGDMLRARPLGLGAGAFVVGLAAQFLDAEPVEPVHNVVLLAASELGWLAGLLWLIAGVATVFGIRRARGTDTVVLSAIVIGLIVIGLGDHYLWSLAPGRTLAWLFLGAWAGMMQKGECVAFRACSPSSE
jgi:O-Antigen ligase